MSKKSYSARAKRNDRIAVWIITAGGVAVIAAVILILLLIVRVALPLFGNAKTALLSDTPTAVVDTPALNVGVDEYLGTGYVVRSDGSFEFYDLDAAAPLGTSMVAPPSPNATAITWADHYAAQSYSLAWNDGSVSVAKVTFTPKFDASGKRTIAHAVEVLSSVKPPEGVKVVKALARANEDGGCVRAALTDDGRFAVSWQTVTKDIFGNETQNEDKAVLSLPEEETVTAFVLDTTGETLYAGTDDGRLLRWDLSTPGKGELKDDIEAFADGRAITTLNLVFGDISLAVGDARGGLTTWFPNRAYPGTEKKQLTLIHTLASHTSAVEDIVPSRRSKALLSLDTGGDIYYDHMTSERHLMTLHPPQPVTLLGFSPRANGFVGLTKTQHLLLWQLDCPHPEVSLKTLFGKVHYENYDEPAYVWQSSAANDDFEPKLSLVPLIFGSFKGTFYAMFYAIPLALFAAVYTSFFTSPRVRAIVKPIVEIMAAIPSVVIGFLAALWLAPIVENAIVPFLASVVVFPTVLLLFVFLWQPFRGSRVGKRVERGYEFIVLIPILLLAAALTYFGGGLLERVAFDGNFQQWLYNTADARYDQRNCIIIAFALGFAVIPIIFTIAEDALSNVPYSLKAASMALGATRWQTVWRVVLPSASPGIFAGAMIGFGRAVGETMIVLMATGNTPIMDWSVFNGMRTLSANIAVEIPEAPLNGTLYRVLFLSAIILFILTSVANTVAELVRQRLRKKYGQF